MSNGEVCCILGVCCPPAAAREKLSVEIEKAGGCDADTSRKCADWLLDTFDLGNHSFRLISKERREATDRRGA